MNYVECYVRGRNDYTNGKSMSDNRFKSGTTAYQAWLEGWMAAVRGDPLLDDDERAALLGLEISHKD